MTPGVDFKNLCAKQLAGTLTGPRAGTARYGAAGEGQAGTRKILLDFLVYFFLKTSIFASS